MPKGDAERIRSSTNFQTQQAQNYLNNLWSGFGADTAEARGRFREAADIGSRDYGNLMGQYQGYADTGGFKPGEEAAIRARAISPTRAVYSNALRNVERQRALQGGYSPGYGTLMGRFAREQSQAAADANTNAEGMLAQMRQQGRLAGMQGMSNLYSATPGQAALYGSMFNQQGNNLLGLQNLQNDIARMNIQGTSAAAQAPTGWDSFQKAASGYGNIVNAFKPR